MTLNEEKRSLFSKDSRTFVDENFPTACDKCNIGSPSIHMSYDSIFCDKDNNYELWSQVSCNCAGQGFTEADIAGIGPSCQEITDLYLDSNKIEEITENTFKEKGFIRFLSIQNSGLKKIHEKAFIHLNKLSQIRLEGNELEILPANLFQQNVDLQTIYLQHNKIHSLGDGIFYNLLNLADLRLSHNFLQNLHQQAFKDATTLSILYLDHNNLTTIHQEWFEHFHTRWTNANRKQSGQIFLDPNPWVCDCSSIDFHNFQINNPFFHDKYDKDEGMASTTCLQQNRLTDSFFCQSRAVNLDSLFDEDRLPRPDEGYVSLGSCQYPHNLKDTKFEDLTQSEIDDFVCQPPRILARSEGKIKVESDEDEMVWVTVDGAPPPRVEFIIRDASNHSVKIEEFEQTPILMPNMDDSHNGPAIKHSIRVLDTVAKQLTVIVTVISPFRQFSDPIHDQFSVEIEKKDSTGHFKQLFFLFLIFILLYVIYIKRETILRKLRSLIPVHHSSSPTQDQTINYSHLPEHDNAALVSNEQIFEPESPQELKINV